MTVQNPNTKSNETECSGECKNRTDAHPCPYQEDVEGDHEVYCDCCEACTDACADNI